MDTLSFRATVFLQTGESPAGRIEMLERYFLRQADATTWCQVMTQAMSGACGSWMVARTLGGRVMELVDHRRLLPGAAADHAIESAASDVRGSMCVEPSSWAAGERAIPLLVGV
jgi:hypothetical protein